MYTYLFSVPLQACFSDLGCQDSVSQVQALGKG